MRLRGATVIACLALAAAAPAGARPGTADQPTVFVSETRVAAPKRIGEFVLQQTRYDPAHKSAGAMLRYGLDDRPDVRIDLFVYPAGEMAEAVAVERELENFLASFDAGVQLKYYSGLRILGTSTFEIAPAGGTVPADAGSPGPAGEDAQSRRAAVIEAALAPRAIVGKRVDLRYRMHLEDTGEDIPMRSRGYLFHKQLYYFKARISIADSQLEEAAYAALSDHAVRTLVPAVSAGNIGACAKTEIRIGRDDLQAGGATAGAVLAQRFGQAMASAGRKNCHSTRAEVEADEPADAEVITLEFAPGDWSAP